MLIHRIAGVALVAALFSAPIGASAGQSSSIGMSEAVVANCSAIPTSFTVNLPDYDPIAPRFNYAYNGAQFQCTKGSSPIFSFDAGPNGTSGNLRQLSDGNGHTLTYLSELCFEPAIYHTYNEISNGGGCILTAPGAAASQQQAVTAYPTGNGGTELIYLQLYNYVYPYGSAWGGGPAQDAPVGHYSDSFTMTLNY